MCDEQLNLQESSSLPEKMNLRSHRQQTILERYSLLRFSISCTVSRKVVLSLPNVQMNQRMSHREICEKKCLSKVH